MNVHSSWRCSSYSSKLGAKGTCAVKLPQSGTTEMTETLPVNIKFRLSLWDSLSFGKMLSLEERLSSDKEIVTFLAKSFQRINITGTLKKETFYFVFAWLQHMFPTYLFLQDQDWLLSEISSWYMGFGVLCKTLQIWEEIRELCLFSESADIGSV